MKSKQINELWNAVCQKRYEKGQVGEKDSSRYGEESEEIEIAMGGSRSEIMEERLTKQ